MQRVVGLWIDHRKAVIVSITDDGEEIRSISSNMEKHVRFSAGSGSQNGSAEDQRDRQFTGHLSRYYDEVIACIRDAESILIMGPGEAKGELEKRLESHELSGRIVGVETVDKLTDRQIAAKVRQRFLKEGPSRK
jgi:stalled ribosome rescue protein Dom34